MILRIMDLDQSASMDSSTKAERLEALWLILDTLAPGPGSRSDVVNPYKGWERWKYLKEALLPEEFTCHSKPKNVGQSCADATRECVEFFSTAASDQALRENLSRAVEEDINAVRAEIGLPSLRAAARAKENAPPAPPSFRSNDEIMAAVRNTARGFTP